MHWPQFVSSVSSCPRWSRTTAGDDPFVISWLSRRHATNKKARCRCDTGLWQPVDHGRAKRHKRNGCAGVFTRRVVSQPAECLIVIRSWFDVGRKKVMEGAILTRRFD